MEGPLAPISSKTRLFALLGEPVSHSLSPLMQNAAFRVLGIDAVYVAVPCQAEDVPGLMQVLSHAGGGGNVTVPHKQVACRYLDQYRGAVRGACNTFWGVEGTVIGDNTDGEGLRIAVTHLNPGSKAWLVLGTGGSAHAALTAAAKAGVGVAVRSRSEDRAKAFLDEALAEGVTTVTPEECDVVINATPLGLRREDPFPLPMDAVPTGAVVLDLVYAPGSTRWVRTLQESGVTASDGRDVLLYQGAAALQCWYPTVTPPLDVMRAALANALG